MNYDAPNDHNRPGMVPHDPPVTASCVACGWHSDMCHCDQDAA